MAGLLTGKLVLVTGATSGIGKAVCKVLLTEGAKVAAVDIKESESDFNPSDFYKLFIVDVSCQTSVSELLKNVEIYFGTVPDGVVNSAGIIGSFGFLKLTEKQFDDVIRVNLKGSYLISQAVAKALVDHQKPGGSIVNISSIDGKTGACGMIDYAASKAGVIGMTKAAAHELAVHGIRCNVVLPGAINTPMLANVPQHAAEVLFKQVPIGRVGEPEEVAQVCAFLLSDKSSYITGACIEVAGGLMT